MSVKCIRIQKCGGNRWGILPRANQRSTGALVAAAPPPCSNPCHQRKSTPLGCFLCRSGGDASPRTCGIRKRTLPRANQRSTGALVTASPPPCSNPCYQRKSTPTGCFSCQSRKYASLKACGIRRGILPRAIKLSTGQFDAFASEGRPVRIPVTKEKAPQRGAFCVGQGKTPA